jgi:NADH-quinone oxidoreductase subunit J
MVLFVFVVMMLNLGGSEIEQERQWLKPQVWIGPAILSAIMLVVIVYAILGVNDQGIDGTPISAKAVGITVRALRTGGGTGFYAAARRSGCGLPRRS